MPSSLQDSSGEADMDSPDNPLSRIQREIIEVTERENEFRRTHGMNQRKMSESDIDLERNVTNGHKDNNENCINPKNMVRAYSTSHLVYPNSPPIQQTQFNKPTNGFTRRFTPSAQKGIMQRFIASKGMMNIPNLLNNSSPMSVPVHNNIKPAFIPPPEISPPVATKNVEGKLVRKGFVPVEEKIQKELMEMKNREIELKKLRKKSNSYQLDLSSLDGSDKEDEYESDEDTSSEPGKLRPTKSIGELYESLGESTSPSPPNGPGSETYGSMKPAKSLAELCDLAPEEQNLAPSSTKLIAKWESLIQQKQESGAA